MKSIRTRLVGNFMLIIMITVAILEIILINGVKQYYYNNVEDIVSDQIKFSSEFYSRYFASSSLEDNIIDNVDVFWQQTSAQVQILDLKGNVLMDSIGVSDVLNLQTADVKKALQGQRGKWVGYVDYDTSSVLAIAYPLKSGDNVIGVLRFITSLRETNDTIKSISIIFIWIGVLVVFISGLVSIFLANSIVKPLREVTSTAEKMASGQLKVRGEKRYDDEIGKLSDTLNYMAGEILKRDQLKNEFISSVSHELRTPLTSIKGWAVTLVSGDLKDRAMLKDGLDIIEKESDRLTRMVEELLDFSKFVSGKISLNKEEVDIREVLEHIERQLSPRADWGKVKLTLEFSGELPFIVGDKNRIKQVFINILDNALKFTPEGGNIKISGARDDEKVKVTVEDTGCGISREDLPYIKEKFYRGKSSKSKNGLGLSICDEIVRLHGGSLEIESEQGLGTRVFVYFPVGKEA